MYYYGMEEEEQYFEFGYAIERIAHEVEEREAPYLVMVEMKNSRNSGVTYCPEKDIFPSEDTDQCGYAWCDKYTPRNGKGGICKHLRCGLVETGRAWKVFPDEEIEKITGRKR
jgi:hypothetical protein